MATVRLTLFEIQYGRLPPVCICCGARATRFVNKTFTWYPRWVGVIKHLLELSICCLPWVFLLMLWKTEAVEIETPLCSDHRDYWRSRRFYTYGGIALLGILGAFIVYLLAVPPKEDSLGGICCFGWLVLLLGWWIGKLIVEHSSIRASYISGESVVLVNISPAFAHMVAVRRNAMSVEDDSEEDLGEDGGK